MQADALEAANADLAQINAVVREAQDAKARSFETASHELRTPLTLTLGPLYDIRRAGTLAAATQAAADLAHANVMRLARLVDDLLEMARLEAGEMPHRPEPPDLACVAPRRWRALCRPGRPATAWLHVRCAARCPGHCGR